MSGKQRVLDFDPRQTDIRKAVRDLSEKEAFELWRKSRQAMDSTEGWWFGSDRSLRAVRLVNPGVKPNGPGKIPFQCCYRNGSMRLIHGAARRVGDVFAHEREEWRRLWDSGDESCAYTPLALDVRGRLGLR